MRPSQIMGSGSSRWMRRAYSCAAVGVSAMAAVSCTLPPPQQTPRSGGLATTPSVSAPAYPGAPTDAQVDAAYRELQALGQYGGEPIALAEAPSREVNFIEPTTRPLEREIVQPEVTPSDERIVSAQGAFTPPAPQTEVLTDGGSPDTVEGASDRSSEVPHVSDPPIPADLDALVTELATQIAARDTPAFRKALAAAGLSLVQPQRPLDPALLDGLDEDQRLNLERYHALLVALAEELERGQQDFDPQSVVSRLNATFGEQPVSIRNVKLCKRVSGFGVYDPFETDGFLAGRSNKVIVYVEVDDFIRQPRNDGEQFEVKLEQEVVLFNEADGLAVWRHTPQQVTDVSRRQRRDFWVVQMVTLPPNLGVGKYRLKVRVTDQHSGAVDETTLPIRLVADEASRVADRPLIEPDHNAEGPVTRDDVEDLLTQDNALEILREIAK